MIAEYRPRPARGSTAGVRRRRIGPAGPITTAVLTATIGLLSPDAAMADAACTPASATVGSDTVLTFTSAASCHWGVPVGVTSVRFLVVAGGGGYGVVLANDGYPGAGGAGGLLTGTERVTPGSGIGVKVGAGGITGVAGPFTGRGDGGNGHPSTFGGVLAVGGGGGSTHPAPGPDGGSGGGGFSAFTVAHAKAYPGGSGTTGQGHTAAEGVVLVQAGSAIGGGGGGAGGAAKAGTFTPGAGYSSDVTGTAVTYAVGGSARSAFRYDSLNPPAGYPNIGGGGSAQFGDQVGDKGSDGVVIVRYESPQPPAPNVPGKPMVPHVPAPSPMASAVPGRPAAPADVTATAGPASVTAGWAPVPGASGYTVTAVPGPATCDVLGVGTSCLLGATADFTYTVSVVAHSARGDSGPSAASNPVTALQPPAPSIDPASVPQTLTTSAGRITRVSPGQDIILQGFDFAANSSVRLIASSPPIDLGSVSTDSTGSFSVHVPIAADLAAGARHLLAAGIDPSGGVHQMALAITVVPRR